MTESRGKASSCARITHFLTSTYRASRETLATLTGSDHPHYPDIPQLRGHVLIGRLFQVGRELGEEMKRMGELAINHPSGMCYEYIGPNQLLLLLTKPEEIHRVMQYDRKGEVISKSQVLQAFGHVFGKNVFIAEGDEWNRQRRMYNDYFIKKNALRNLKPEIQSAIDHHVETLTEEKCDSRTIKLSQFCTDLAMIVIATTRMGTEIPLSESLRDLQSTIAKTMHEVADYRNSVRIMLSQKLHLPLSGPTEKAKTGLQNEFLKHIVTEAHTHRILETDNLFRATTARAANRSPDEIRVEDLKSEQALCDGTFLLLAGHETTSKLIEFILRELSGRPKMVEKIREELRAVDMNALTTDDLKTQLPYLNSVINETLRLYPPVPVFARKVMQDFKLGDRLIHAGTLLTISPLMTHLREDVSGAYPEKFNPGRWNKQKNPNLYAPGAFIPFGDGARICVGGRFAVLEATLAIATLIQRFNFKLEMTPDQDPSIFFETYFEGTLKPAHEAAMTFTRRCP